MIWRSQQGSRFPYTVLREVIENLIHAFFKDVVITILDQGNTIRISDHGPGISNKDLALRPGFTTAGPEQKRYIRGVGSGLPIASESLAYLEGMLEIEDNLGEARWSPSASPSHRNRPRPLPLREDRTPD